jgi:hypothetical protein
VGFKYVPNAQNPSMADIAEQLKKANGTTSTSTEALAETPKAIEEKVSTKPPEYVDVEKCLERIRIVFDDSASMQGQEIVDAREGVIEFMRNCIPNQVAVAVHPFQHNEIQLTSNLPVIATKVKTIGAIADFTPLFTTWQEAQNKVPKATRFIIFSDGLPSDRNLKEYCIRKSIVEEIPCDTILISTNPNPESDAYRLLKEIAYRTGGIFMVFDRTKMDFRTGFKYLAPKNRLALNAPGVKEAIEQGRLV